MRDDAAHANQSWWDSDAAAYHAAHPDYLSSFYWSPEMLHEEDVKLLGDTSDQRILELGCGSAPCTHWLQGRAQFATGFDLSRGMLAHAAPDLPLAQADARALPYAASSFDTVFSAFGALPFVPDLLPIFAEVARVLRKDVQQPGRFVFSVAHPMRWMFADDPNSLEVTYTYFDKSYTEGEPGNYSYAEYHHTMGDYVRTLNEAGFELVNLLEPTWPEGLVTTWGQWSPQRGRIMPGTAIFSAQLRPS